MSLRKVTDCIEPMDRKSPDDLFLVASSFEPRSVQASGLLQKDAADQALLFQYEDTLDTTAGLFHSRELRKRLSDRCRQVVPFGARYTDAYSAVRQLHLWLGSRPAGWSPGKLTIDCSCFTKLHLLLLLQYINQRLPAAAVRLLYTAPLSYATAFGKQLSHGVRTTVYIPVNPGSRKRGLCALVAFLGHEALRVRRSIQGVEPDQVILAVGRPGFSPEMCRISRRIHQDLLDRARYDCQFRVTECSNMDPDEGAELLLALFRHLGAQGYTDFYVAPLGTKLQALAIPRALAVDPTYRVVIAYPIPRSYERSLYSQGSGGTYEVEGREGGLRPARDAIEVGHQYFLDASEIPEDAESEVDDARRREIVRTILVSRADDLRQAFLTAEVEAVVVCGGEIRQVARVGQQVTDEELSELRQRHGKACFLVARSDFEGRSSTS